MTGRRVALLLLLALTLGGASKGSASPATTSRVPILMYHVVAAPPAGAPYPALYVPQREFASQMRWLAAHGYHAVTLDQVMAGWRGGRSLPPNPVVVTFDDGYRSIYRNAFPVLRALGWRAVLNLEIHNEGVSWGLSPVRVRALIRAGWEVDSHTFTHPDLTSSSAAQLSREVGGSRRDLQRRYGIPVNFFCYPAGRYDARVIAAVRAAGYMGALTTRYGLAGPDDPYELARVRVNGGDGAAGLAAKLRALGA